MEKSCPTPIHLERLLRDASWPVDDGPQTGVAWLDRAAFHPAGRHERRLELNFGATGDAPPN